MNIEALQKQFTGEVITSEDVKYPEYKDSLFAKGSPAVVLRARNKDDVALAISYAQENSLKLSVRSGGHSGAGFSTNEGGVVIDLSPMNNVKLIDEKARVVQVEGGAIWIDIAKTLHKHGLALSSGDTKSVGVGGLTLGAGIGWMVREYGMAIDSLVAAEVVLADGSIVRASKDENTDLFWAVRGGGGNFGVVTVFEFTAHPVGKVYSGNITYGLDDVPRIIKGWRDAMRTAPDELTTMLLVMPSFMGMPPSAIILVCYAGDDKAAVDAALKPFRNLGKVLSDDVAEKEYYEVLEEAHPPQGMRIITKNGFVPEFTDELVMTISDMFKDGATGPVLQIRSLGGAASRVAPDATAFAHRDAEALIVNPNFLPSDAPAAMEKAALVQWDAIKPFTDGGYIGFYTEDEDISLMYPAKTHRRLSKIKKQYDPQNMFNQNYNIQPE